MGWMFIGVTSPRRREGNVYVVRCWGLIATGSGRKSRLGSSGARRRWGFTPLGAFTMSAQQDCQGFLGESRAGGHTVEESPGEVSRSCARLSATRSATVFTELGARWA